MTSVLFTHAVRILRKERQRAAPLNVWQPRGMGSGNSRPSPGPPPPSPPPSFPPPLPPAPYTQQLLESGATCARTAVSAGVGFDAASCMKQAAAANGPYYCFALAPAIGACYVCEACEPSSPLIGHSFYRWWDIYSPLPPPTPVPPAPLESRLLAADTLCTDQFDLAEHGNASGFDEQSCFDAAVDALYPAADACFALHAAAGACYVCKNCTPTLSNVFGYALYSATWHFSPPTPPSPSPPPSTPPPPQRPPALPPPSLPPAPYTQLLLGNGAHCAHTAVSAGVGFDAAGCMQQAAAANGSYWCFALAPAIGACYVCEACESSSLIGHSFYRWFDIYSPSPPPLPIPSSLPRRRYPQSIVSTDH